MQSVLDSVSALAVGEAVSLRSLVDGLPRNKRRCIADSLANMAHRLPAKGIAYITAAEAKREGLGDGITLVRIEPL